MSVNDREYRSGSIKWTIHRNWQHRSHKTKNKNQANTNNVNKTWSLLQTTEGKDEPTIVCMRKSQHGTQNVKTHNRRTQHTEKMSNMDLNDRSIFCKRTTPIWVQSVFINIDRNLTALFNEMKTNLKKCLRIPKSQSKVRN